MASLNISDFIAVMRKSDELNDRNFVRKENGKSLSTNDYSNEDKAKLASIDVEEIAGKTYMQELINGAITNINENINTKMDALSASVGEKLDALGGTLTVTYDSDTNLLTWSESQNLYSEVLVNNECIYSGNDTSCKIIPILGDNIVDVIALDKLTKEVKQGTITITIENAATLTIDCDEYQTVESVKFDNESVEYSAGMVIPSSVEKIYVKVSKYKTMIYTATESYHYLDFEYTFDNEDGKHFKIKPFNLPSYYSETYNTGNELMRNLNVNGRAYFYPSSERNMYISFAGTANSDSSKHAICFWNVDTQTSYFGQITGPCPMSVDIVFDEKVCLKNLFVYTASDAHAIKKFDIQGSNDGINWTSIQSDITFEGYITPDEQKASFSSNKSFYRYNRILIKELYTNETYVNVRLFRFTVLKEGSVI